MAQNADSFRKSFFESVPAPVPLAITGISIAMAIKTFIAETQVWELPSQYATAALFVSLAGLSFSFYVTLNIT